MVHATRRQLITLLGSAAAAWPLAARAQQPLPVIGFLGPSSAQVSVKHLEAFRKGLSESGYVDGRTVALGLRWAGRWEDRMSQFRDNLVRRQLGVLAAQ